MGLILGFLARPCPLGGCVDVADDRLPALGDIALIERLAVDKSLRRILGWERRSQVPFRGS